MARAQKVSGPPDRAYGARLPPCGLEGLPRASRAFDSHPELLGKGLLSPLMSRGRGCGLLGDSAITIGQGYLPHPLPFGYFLHPTTLHPFVHRRQDGLDMHGWRPTSSVHAGVKNAMEIRGGLAGSINERYLEAMDRRSDGHTDRRTYGQTVRGSGVQTARRSKNV